MKRSTMKNEGRGHAFSRGVILKRSTTGKWILFAQPWPLFSFEGTADICLISRLTCKEAALILLCRTTSYLLFFLKETRSLLQHLIDTLELSFFFIREYSIFNSIDGRLLRKIHIVGNVSSHNLISLKTFTSNLISLLIFYLIKLSNLCSCLEISIKSLK